MGYITVYSMEYASLWAASLARLLATHARSNVARSGAHKKATSSRGVTQTQAVLSTEACLSRSRSRQIDSHWSARSRRQTCNTTVTLMLDPE